MASVNSGREALLLALLLAPGAALAQDADGDGAPDTADAFPCDASRAAASYYPSEDASALLVFEDQWPGSTDLDFNDVAVRVHYRADHNAAGQVVRLRAVIDPVAVGGQLSNGLALQLPTGRSGVTARRRIAGGAWQTLALEGDAQATLIVSPNLRELFGNTEGRINSLPEEPTVSGQRLELEITLGSGVVFPTAQAPYDLFVFRAGDLGHQIHLPRYAGTAAMNTALFGSAEDGSTAERHFVHVSGIPAALNLMTTAFYPQEGVEVSDLFPRILGFAASAGASDQDFYASGVQPAAGFAVSAPVIAADPADHSCRGFLAVDSEPLSINAAPTLTAQRVLPVVNTGNATLIITALELTGADAARFSVSGCTTPFTLGQGATCNLTLTFAPEARPAATNAVAALRVVHTGRNGSEQIALIGDTSYTQARPQGASGATPPTLSGQVASWGSGASYGGFTVGNSLRNAGRFAVAFSGTAASLNALEYNIQTQTGGVYYGVSFPSGTIVRGGVDIVNGSSNGTGFARPSLANNDRIVMTIDYGARNVAWYHCPVSTGVCAANPFHSVNGIVPSTRSLRIYSYKTGNGAASVTITATGLTGLPASQSAVHNGTPM